jgi:hypothetical protein
MKKQLDIEQKQFQKELVTYYGWINQSRILLEIMLRTINIKWKSYMNRSNFNKNTIFMNFNRWSI